MNRIFVLITALLFSVAAFAGEDRSVTIEFIFGIGGTDDHAGFALRYSEDNVEGHVAHWFGDRSNTAFGVGFVADTEGKGQEDNMPVHASATAGFAFLLRTNSVLENHLNPYVRAAAGFDLADLDGDTEMEFSLSRYGFTNAETFGGIGLRFNDRYEAPQQKTVASSQDVDDSSDDDDDSDGSDDECKGDCTEVPPTGCVENCDDDSDDDSDGDDAPPVDDTPPEDDDTPPEDDDTPPEDDDGNNGNGNDDGDDPSNPGNDDDDPNDGNNGGGNDDNNEDDDGNNGHGNDEDGCDESNPGNGKGPKECRE